MRRTFFAISLSVGLLSAACGKQSPPISVAATETPSTAPAVAPTSVATTVSSTTIPPATLGSTATAKPTTTAPTATTPVMANYDRDFGRVQVAGSALLINQEFAPVADRFTEVAPERWQSIQATAVYVAVNGGKVVGIVSTQDNGRNGGQILVPGFAYGMSLGTLQGLYPEMTLDRFGGQVALSRQLPNGTFYAVGNGCTTGGIDTVAIAATGYKSTAESLIVLGNCDPSHSTN